ncbi:hypothetical protein SAMN06265360_10222 [Haloechinothrix alba]|uniref:Integral membrane protein n=1 Tax=Haloechinothrix alba TaxID=664784 RepID=A0A238VBW8_9PSEU|nr:hypothetical protein [Haloechinothrix alba]SNR31746.1 hypothetical protein SAMN06265360_10222 [Haloechinothrix alba]
MPAPLQVRLAGLLVALPGLFGMGFSLVLLLSAVFGSATTQGGNSVYGEAAYYAVLGGGTLACGIGLLLGQLWARSPSLVVAVILAGAGWYMLGPSSRPELGLPLLALTIGVVVLLFRQPSKAWALGQEGADLDGPEGGRS